MTTAVLRASFDLHQAGLTSQALIKAEAVDTTKTRGNAASGAAIFTDTNRDFTADGVTTSYRVAILEGGGNIARDTTISAVGTTTITVGGGNFDTTENNLLYAVYLPESDADIVADPAKRGTGIAGYEEWLQKIESENTIDLETKLIDLSYDQGLTQQVIVFDDTA